MGVCALRCGEITENEFDSSSFVGKSVYIYTKVSPFIKNWKQIFLPMRKWLGKFCRPPFRPKKIYSQIQLQFIYLIILNECQSKFDNFLFKNKLRRRKMLALINILNNTIINLLCNFLLTTLHTIDLSLLCPMQRWKQIFVRQISRE